MWSSTEHGAAARAATRPFCIRHTTPCTQTSRQPDTGSGRWGGGRELGIAPPAFYLVCALRRCFTIFIKDPISMYAVRRKGEQGGPAMSACMCAPKRRPPSPERGLRSRSEGHSRPLSPQHLVRSFSCSVSVCFHLCSVLSGCMLIATGGVHLAYATGGVHLA